MNARLRTRWLFLLLPLLLLFTVGGAACWHYRHQAPTAADQAADAEAVDAALNPGAGAPAPPPPPPGIAGYRRLDLELPLPLVNLLGRARPGLQVNGILVAPARQTVLWACRDQEPTPIASMTKMMTLLVALESLAQRPDLNLQSRVRISREAQRIGGSEVWLAAGNEYPLEALLQAAVVKSANDAAYAVAEALAPQQDVRKFVILMNRRARQLGLTQARFYNVHGLPGQTLATENRATCQDLVVLALAFAKHDALTAWCRLPLLNFKHHNGKIVEMHNSNRDLLLHCPGVTGLKTGFTDRAGFCVTATCVRQGEPLIAVVTGFNRKEDRFAFVSQLFNWGYAQLPSAAAPPAPPQ